MKKYTIGERILDKMLSGRFICTLVVCLVYAFLACNGTIDTKDIIVITTLILNFYFFRDRSQDLQKSIEEKSENLNNDDKNNSKIDK